MDIVERKRRPEKEVMESVLKFGLGETGGDEDLPDAAWDCMGELFIQASAEESNDEPARLTLKRIERVLNTGERMMICVNALSHRQLECNEAKTQVMASALAIEWTTGTLMSDDMTHSSRKAPQLLDDGNWILGTLASSMNMKEVDATICDNFILNCARLIGILFKKRGLVQSKYCLSRDKVIPNALLVLERTAESPEILCKHGAIEFVRTLLNWRLNSDRYIHIYELIGIRLSQRYRMKEKPERDRVMASEDSDETNPDDQEDSNWSDLGLACLAEYVLVYNIDGHKFLPRVLSPTRQFAYLAEPITTLLSQQAYHHSGIGGLKLFDCVFFSGTEIVLHEKRLQELFKNLILSLANFMMLHPLTGVRTQAHKRSQMTFTCVYPSSVRFELFKYVFRCCPHIAVKGYLVDAFHRAVRNELDTNFHVEEQEQIVGFLIKCLHEYSLLKVDEFIASADGLMSVLVFARFVFARTRCSEDFQILFNPSVVKSMSECNQTIDSRLSESFELISASLNGFNTDTCSSTSDSEKMNQTASGYQVKYISQSLSKLQLLQNSNKQLEETIAPYITPAQPTLKGNQNQSTD